ncbi:uncharacterized protein LOC134839789 [Symsagittifera roscoffensis]|uniref:uncharacterized protein LOC134839789 n=1 Tax=Symsagittifera roscoffensis TaxID=84072 RepID=UPI00307B7509
MISGVILRIEVCYEYVRVGVEEGVEWGEAEGDEPVWYYGHVSSSPLNAFPKVPLMGLIPVSHVTHVIPRDLDINLSGSHEDEESDEGKDKEEGENENGSWSEEGVFCGDLVSLSHCWPTLTHRALATSPDLGATVLTLESQLKAILNEVKRCLLFPAVPVPLASSHSIVGLGLLEGNYDQRGRDRLQHLSLLVDRFCRQLQLRQVLVRSDQMGLSFKPGPMTQFHDKFVRRRDQVLGLNSLQRWGEIQTAFIQQTITLTPPTPSAASGGGTVARFGNNNSRSNSVTGIEIPKETRSLFLFVKLQSLKMMLPKPLKNDSFGFAQTRKHWLRVSVYFISSAQTAPQGDRPGELMQEPFLVYLPLPMSVGYSSQGDGLNTAPSPQDKIEIGQYLTPYTASCLFERVSVCASGASSSFLGGRGAAGNSKVRIYCDLLVQSSKGSLEVIAKCGLPLGNNEMDAMAQGMIHPTMAHSQLQQPQLYSENDFSLRPTASALTTEEPSQTKPKGRKDSCSPSYIQHHDSSLVEGRLIMQMVVAESSARARQLLNLPPRPSADRPMEEGDQGMGEGLLQCSIPIRPVGATISPANVGLGVGGVWNFAHLRLRRLWLGAKKDKEKRLFVRVQLIRLKDETDKFQVVDEALRVGVGAEWCGQYISPSFTVPKHAKGELLLPLEDLVTVRFGSNHLQHLFLLFSIYKENHQQQDSVGGGGVGAVVPEFELFLPLSNRLCAENLDGRTARRSQTNLALQAYTAVISLQPRNLPRVNPFPGQKLSGKRSSIGSSSHDGGESHGTSGTGGLSHFGGGDCKAVEEKLDVDLHVMSSLSSASGKIVALLQSIPDQKMFYEQTMNLENNFPDALWVMPQVLLKVLGYLSEKMDLGRKEWDNGWAFLLDLLSLIVRHSPDPLQLNTDNDTTSKEGSGQTLDCCQYLVSREGGFLNLLNNSRIWKFLMTRFIDSLEKLASESVPSDRDSRTSRSFPTPSPETTPAPPTIPEIHSIQTGLAAFTASGLGMASAVPQRASTAPLSSVSSTTPAQLREEMKLFRCSSILWPWIKQSLSLHVIKENSRGAHGNSHKIFKTSPEALKGSDEFCQLSARLISLLEGGHKGGTFIRLSGEEEALCMAQFYTHAFIAFPHFHGGLRMIRRLNLQMSHLSLCYTSAEHLRQPKYRNVLSGLVRSVLSHTVQVQSALKKYYPQFSQLLTHILTFYHTNTHTQTLRHHDNSPQGFQMQSRDVDFLLVVFENINFWLQSGYTSTHHSKGTRDSAQSDPPEAEEDDEDQADGDDDDDSGLPPGVNDSCYRVLCCAVQFIQLASSVDLVALSKGNVVSLARRVRQLLKIAHEVLCFSRDCILPGQDYLLMKVHICLQIYNFLFHDSNRNRGSSVFDILLHSRHISPNENCEQYIYVFELLLQVCHELVCSDQLQLERMGPVTQNMLKLCIRRQTHQADPEALSEQGVCFLDVRHSIAYLLKELHNAIIWPLVLSVHGKSASSGESVGLGSGKFFERPYPLRDILHMSLSSPEGYTLSAFCEILAALYCLLTKLNPHQAFSELVKEVDTFIGFKHKMGDQAYVDTFRSRMIERVNLSPLVDASRRQSEVKRIESVTSVQMKDLLSVRSSVASGLDPDLLILYTSDLLKFYAGDRLYKVSTAASVDGGISPSSFSGAPGAITPSGSSATGVGDLSENVLFIRYHMRIYSLNVTHHNLTSAAETLMEFVMLLERLDEKNKRTRPNSVAHLADEVPSEFYREGFTTLEMSIHILNKAATLYEQQKLYEAADYARDQLSNFYYRKLDYEGIAINNVHRAQLACKIKGVSLREKVDQILPPETGGFDITDSKRKTGRGILASISESADKMQQQQQQQVSSVRTIHTRGFQLQFYMVKFPRVESSAFPGLNSGPGADKRVQIPKVFEGKTFIYSGENLSSFELENYLRTLFPHHSVVREEHDKQAQTSDIVYAQLHPQLWLPKRFKMALFLSSDSPDVEFYRTHAISMFEKRIPVSEVDELKDIEFDDDTAKMLFNYDACGSDKERQKLLKEWKQNLRAAAVFGMKVTKYKLTEQNLVNRNDTELYPGKCRWQPIAMAKPPSIKHSCELAKTELVRFLQTVCDIYFQFHEQKSYPARQLQTLRAFMELISKIISPIQGGLKKQCLAFLSPQYRERVGKEIVRAEFEKYLGELLRALVVVSRTIEQFVESSRDEEALRGKGADLELLLSAAGQYDTHLASIFDEKMLKTEGDSRAVMMEVKQFLRTEHLYRVTKTDPCIHEQDRNLTGDLMGRIAAEELEGFMREGGKRASLLIEEWTNRGKGRGGESLLPPIS